MSLDDTNVRRVLATSLAGQQPGEPRHFAVMRKIDVSTVKDLPGTRPSIRQACAADANKFRIWYWRQYGVEVINLPSYEAVLPFLVRLRYESWGRQPGDLWRRGFELGYAALNPWAPDQQHIARLCLDDAVKSIQQSFSIPAGEITELGIYLLKEDCKSLELTFASGPLTSTVGLRNFPVDIDRPIGIIARAFVFGEALKVIRHDQSQTLPNSDENIALADYEGVIAFPIIDWQENGIPIGVVYLTTSDTEGVLFKMPYGAGAGTNHRSLEDVYPILQRIAMGVVSILRKLGRKD